MLSATININGQILSPKDSASSSAPDLNDAKISVFDRSYLYGDSLYEVIRSYQGKFFRLEEHLKRLEKSAVLCRMTLGQNINLYRDELYRTFQIFKDQAKDPRIEAYARIIISRGVGKIGFGLSSLLSSTHYTIIVQPVEPPTPEQYKKGLKLKTVDRLRNDRRALDPAMKSGNYLNSLLAYLEADAENFDDALLCNSQGHLTEGTTFNLFYARRGILATPPLDIGILDGITRREVIQIARNLSIEVREVRFPKERLYEADEVFLTSSIKEVMAVTQIDQKKIGTGSPGPLTQKLHEAYQKLTLGKTSP